MFSEVLLSFLSQASEIRDLCYYIDCGPRVSSSLSWLSQNQSSIVSDFGISKDDISSDFI